MYSEAKLEAEYQMSNFQGHPAYAKANLDEDVFLAQLHRRAVLLNGDFQRSILHAVNRHSHDSKPQPAFIMKEIDSISPCTEGQREPEEVIRPSFSSALLTFQKSKCRTVNLNKQHYLHLSEADECKDFPTHRISSPKEAVQITSIDSESDLRNVTQKICEVDSFSSHQAVGINDPASAAGKLSIGDSADVCSSNLSSSRVANFVRLSCRFNDGPASVDIYSAPVKTITRMREKILEYAKESKLGDNSDWPLCANILDPVRASIVCSGPSQILQIYRWFADDSSLQASDVTQMTVCRIKNKFAFAKEELIGGCVIIYCSSFNRSKKFSIYIFWTCRYRDLLFCVVFTGPYGLRIIGEVQVNNYM